MNILKRILFVIITFMVVIWSLICLRYVQLLEISNNSYRVKFDYTMKARKAILENQEILQTTKDSFSKAKFLTNRQIILRADPLNINLIKQTWLANQKYFDQKRRLELLSFAERIKPNDRISSVLRLNYFFSIEDYEAVINEVNLLYRLEEDEREKYIEFLILLFKEDAAFKSLKNALRGNPEWGYEFLSTLSNLDTIDQRGWKKLTELIVINFLSMGEDLRRIWLFKNYGFNSIKRGDPDIAYQAWLSLQNEEFLLDENNLVYNSKLNHNSSPPPFNWLLYGRPISKKDFDGKHQLPISYRKGKTSILVQQIIKVPINTGLVLQVVGDAKVNRASAKLEWRIYCANSRKRLGKFQFNSQDLNIGPLKYELSGIKNSCEYIDLQLLGLDSDFQGTTTFDLNSISLSRKID